MALDGTDVITPTPFDAHEQVVRASNPNVTEYPKAVDHVEKLGPHGEPTGQFEPVLVNNAEEEAAYKAAQTPKESA